MGISDTLNLKLISRKIWISIKYTKISYRSQLGSRRKYKVFDILLGHWFHVILTSDPQRIFINLWGSSKIHIFFVKSSVCLWALGLLKNHIIFVKSSVYLISCGPFKSPHFYVKSSVFHLSLGLLINTRFFSWNHLSDVKVDPLGFCEIICLPIFIGIMGLKNSNSCSWIHLLPGHFDAFSSIFWVQKIH